MRWRAINFPELDSLLLLWLPSPIYVVLMVTTMLVGVRHVFFSDTVIWCRGLQVKQHQHEQTHNQYNQNYPFISKGQYITPQNRPELLKTIFSVIINLKLFSYFTLTRKDFKMFGIPVVVGSLCWQMSTFPGIGVLSITGFIIQKISMQILSMPVNDCSQGGMGSIYQNSTQADSSQQHICTQL